MSTELNGYDPILLKTWGQVIGNKGLLTRTSETMIGLEFEFEGLHITTGKPAEEWHYWVPHNEGSLRNGIELTLSRPMPEDDALNVAMDEFMAIISKASFENSIRTSTHLHINIMNKTMLQIYTFLTAWYLVENVLVHLHGRDREGNLHCLRLVDAVEIASHLATEISQENYFRTWSNTHRYAALNIAAIKKFGSVEYRFLKALTDRQKITMWVRNLTSLFNVSTTKFQTPQEVMTYYYASKTKVFLETFFDRELLEEIRTNIEPGVVRSMLAGNTAYVYEIISGLTHHSYQKEYLKPHIIQQHEDLPTINNGATPPPPAPPLANIVDDWHDDPITPEWNFHDEEE